MISHKPIEYLNVGIQESDTSTPFSFSQNITIGNAFPSHEIISLKIIEFMGSITEVVPESLILSATNVKGLVDSNMASTTRIAIINTTAYFDTRTTFDLTTNHDINMIFDVNPGTQTINLSANLVGKFNNINLIVQIGIRSLL